MREKKTCLSQELDQMTTAQLDDIVQAELQKDLPDEHIVLPILKALEERESEKPAEISGSAYTAWDRFRKRVVQTGKKRHSRRWVAGVATATAIVCLVFLTIPLGAEADTPFERLLYIADRVLQFFDPDRDSGNLQSEYVFETDHPGLQQLHDEMTARKVTAPVVPMWIPDGYDLAEVKTSSKFDYEKVHAIFLYGTNSIEIQYKLVTEATTTQYEVKNRQAEVYESFGVYHTIIENEEDLSVVWKKNGVECLVVGDLEKKDLHEIVDSIYRRKTQ